MARKTIAVDEAMHAKWLAEAKKQGVSIAAYVTTMVEASRRGVALLPDSPPIVVRLPTARAVDPKDCTNRVREGTWCKTCGSVHKMRK